MSLSLSNRSIETTESLQCKLNSKIFYPIAFQVKDYSNFLHLLIYDCPSIHLKLKLANFFAIHQAENRISYKYILQMWDLTSAWFLFFVLESVSIVILIYSFNYLKSVAPFD